MFNFRLTTGAGMPETASASGVVRFDIFEIDLRAGELRKQGRRLKLQEQPLRVLSLLLERPGNLVTRDQLRQSLWPADTFVDFDHGLNSAVARLRETLCDSADQPRFIETIAKRGYRFIAPLHDPAASAPLASAVPPVPLPSSPYNTHWSKLWLAVVPLLLLIFAAGIWNVYRSNRDTPPGSIEIVPLVGLRGFQVTPAFSRDGNLVAFRQSDGSHNTGIYSALVGGEKSLQLHQRPGRLLPNLVSRRTTGRVSSLH